MRITLSTLAAVGLVLTATSASAEACRTLGTVGALIEGLGQSAALEPGLAEAFCEDYGRMAERLTDAEIEMERLQAALTAAEASAAPVGSVLLMDRGQGCPDGWTDVAIAEPDVFAGRTPVAIGFAEGREFRGYRQVGGGETHRLAETELPPHAHGLPLAFARMPGEERIGTSLTTRLTTGQQVAVPSRTGRELSDRSGGAQPFSLMQPYVALFFCRRD